MTTLLLILGAVIVLLVVLDRIPGLQHLIRPIVGWIASGITLLVGSASGWLAWSVKTVWRDHATLARHLFSTRADIDPSEKYRR